MAKKRKVTWPLWKGTTCIFFCERCCFEGAVDTKDGFPPLLMDKLHRKESPDCPATWRELRSVNPYAFHDAWRAGVTLDCY